MYKVLIADDELLIREGLRDIIDWNSYGFQTCAIFDDGKGILDYLAENNADVVITDIKMISKTGLEVAEYIYENKLPVKVILISGYKELEFAMSAIKFNVEEYVLKPIDIDVLICSLNKVKQALDEEAAIKVKEVELESIEKEIIDLKDTFFEELMIGAFQSKSYIRSMFRLLYPKLNIEQCPCLLATISIENYEDFICQQWTHTNSELYDYLKNFISLASTDIHYSMISKDHNCIQLFGIQVNNATGCVASEMIELATSKICSDLKDIFQMHAVVSELEIFENALELSHNRGSFQDKTLNKSLMMKIDEQQKAVYSAVYTGNTEAYHNVVKRFLEYIRNLDLNTVRTIVADLLITIHNKLSESSLDISNSLLFRQGCTPVYELDTFEEIDGHLNRLLLDLLGITKEMNQDEGNVIERAKSYIVDNITEDISLEDISTKFYMSQYYFSRIFKTRTGENYIDFVIRKKMEHAIELLKKPEYKIYEISNMIGYKSNRYFARTFKNHTGYTPRDYRKLL